MLRRNAWINDAFGESSDDIIFACTSLELRGVVKVRGTETKRRRQWPISAAVLAVATGATVRMIELPSFFHRGCRTGSDPCQAAGYSRAKQKMPLLRKSQRLFGRAAKSRQLYIYHGVTLRIFPLLFEILQQYFRRLSVAYQRKSHFDAGLVASGLKSLSMLTRARERHRPCRLARS
jgi:hypothetical protein